MMTYMTQKSGFDIPIVSDQTSNNSEINLLESSVNSFLTVTICMSLSTLNVPLIRSSTTNVLDTNQNISVEEQGVGQILNRNRQDIKTIARIRELGSYQKGWYDGCDGCPASPQAIKDAEMFVRNLDLNHIHLPYISLAKDGEVNFWWDIEAIKLDLGFYGDGTYSYYAKLGDDSELFEDEASVSFHLPQEILERLQK